MDDVAPWEQNLAGEPELIEYAVERAVTAWLDRNAEALADRIAERVTEAIGARRASPAVGPRRPTARPDDPDAAVLDAIHRHPGEGRNRLTLALVGTVPQSQVRRSLHGLVESRRAHVHAGPNRARLHFAGASCADCPTP